MATPIPPNIIQTLSELLKTRQFPLFLQMTGDTVLAMHREKTPFEMVRGNALADTHLDALLLDFADAHRDEIDWQAQPDAILVVVSNLFIYGGHSLWVEEVVRVALAARRPVTVLFTDILGKYPHPHSLSPRLRELGVQVICLPGGADSGQNYARFLAGVDTLRAVRAGTVFLFNHHEDAVAVALGALSRSVARVIFVHHADHGLCLGAATHEFVHCDGYGDHYDYCRAWLGHENYYLPVSVSDLGVRPHPPLSGGLQTASCGSTNKFSTPYRYSYFDVIAGLIARQGITHHHIGFLLPEQVSVVRAAIAAAGGDPGCFVYHEHVESLWSFLIETAIDIYLGSFPVGGGRAVIEAMGAGVPVIIHATAETDSLTEVNVIAPGMHSWETPQELEDLLAGADACWRAEQSQLGRRYFEQYYDARLLSRFVADLPSKTHVLPPPPFRKSSREPWPVRLLAFYLPQFHAIAENDRWWGKGFTEWDNVRQGEPLFDGHEQPHTPSELGYYDLTDISVLDRQARLARAYGLEGFCFYHYWFDGRRLLEKPVDLLLRHPEIELPFCLCWANENWTRRWDGGEQEILIRQNYSAEFNEQFALDLLPYLGDQRYIRVNGKPLILVYRADIIPDLYSTVMSWRAIWQKNGVGEVYLVCVESFTTRIPSEDGFDAACEFFPHQIDFSQLLPASPVSCLKDQAVKMADYQKMVEVIEARAAPSYRRFRGVIPSWDNSARRRKGGATLFVNETPARYEQWLTNSIRKTLIEQEGDERLVFINAWNEWGEGCHLEPDTRHGRAWLEATLRAQRSALDVDVYQGRHVQPYQDWLARSRPEMASVKLEAEWPLVLIVDATQATADQLALTLKSVAAQQYEALQILVVSASSAPQGLGQRILWLQSPEVPAQLVHEFAVVNPQSWLCVVQAGDLLVEGALWQWSMCLQARSATVLVYGDEDRLDEKYGPVDPVFRPDFDLDYLRSFPYQGRVLFFRGEEYLELGGFDLQAGSARFYDYTLRVAERYGEAAVAHVPAVLIHLAPTRYETDTEARHERALRAHLQRLGLVAEIESGLLPGSFRVCYRHEATPLISILIPTRNQLLMLQRCIETLLEKTAYPNYEILVVDNQSTDVDAVAYLQGLAALELPNLRVLSYPHPFNFSAMNNLAVREARGEYLVLLNNDTAVLKADWLDALLNHAQRPDVGIVGAKLLYPDGKVQHAGVILGLRGPADHPFMGEKLDSPGYAGRLLLDQQYSAVTAACMMVRKSVYEQIGGMDEDTFVVSYNDVDFCLRAKQAGWRIIWTPHALVMHEGNVSQKKLDPKDRDKKEKRFIAERQAMYKKWLPNLVRDPAYNPNFGLSGCGFELESDSLFNSRFGMTLPKILAHNADRQGSGSYRMIQPLKAMSEAGWLDGFCREHSLDPVHLLKAKLDVIVFQRQIKDWQLQYIRDCRDFSGAALIYELDDYLPNLPVANIHRNEFPKDISRRLKQAISLCDRVVVSTEVLKSALNGLHQDICVLPNYLPVEWWGGLAPRPAPDFDRKPRVGWAGGVSHTGDLRLIADVVTALADRVDWVFFGMMPDGVDASMVEFHPGIVVQEYPKRLAGLDLDLALAPLENNFFNECKSNLRLLEYGVCGYPVIATNIEPYRCGLPVTLVKNRHKDWVSAIDEKLADRAALYAEGLRLQTIVRQQWMLDGNNLKRWHDGWLAVRS